MADDNRGQAVSLGCGTLILIALIVLFFSNRGHDEVKREIRGLRSEVAGLRGAVEAQTALIKGLQAKPGRQQPEPGEPVDRDAK
jgi:hypothetical protein